MELLVTSLLVAFLMFGIVATIYMVGKPRQPLTAGVAAGVTLFTLLQIAGVLYLAAT